MKIHIVNYHALNGWILTKIATRLKDALVTLGYTVTMGMEIDPSADINHHITFHSYIASNEGIHTVLITHIDNSSKLNKIAQDLHTAMVGICMSKATMMELIRLGLPKEKLQYAHMANDGLALPRKITIGFTTQLYADGRKRQDYFHKIIKKISPDDFKFEIMGFGWGPTIEKMRALGFEVNYVEDFDYNTYMNLLTRLDYYAYFGNDEGSAGFIDALAAGVKTIVQPQGFHLDAPNGITHAFTNFEELDRIFLEIASERHTLVNAVAEWTWENYAKKHALIWEGCLNNLSDFQLLEKTQIEFARGTILETMLARLKLTFNLFKHKSLLVLNLTKRKTFPSGSRFYGPKKNK